MTERRFFGRAFVRGAIQDDTLITVRDGVIVSVEQKAHAELAEKTTALIGPGLVDVHVHGGAGADFMDGDEEANGRILAFHAKHGTTTLAATTLSAARADLHEAVRAIAATARSAPDGAEICAIHLEGPYINLKRAGAQDAASIRPADIHEIAALLAEGPRLQWIITVAPEIAGVRALIEQFRDRVLFSIGHTSADYAEAVAALEWGARHFTHLFNAMTGMHHREPGVAGAALVSADATAELIADGIHVHPAVMRVATMLLPHRIALVTDAIRACGMPAGGYKLYGYDVRVDAEGGARLANGTLAGSTLTMDRAVKNMVELAGVPIETVIPLATEVPARIIDAHRRKGKIEVGYDADLVFFNTRLEVERVMVRGR